LCAREDKYIQSKRERRKVLGILRSRLEDIIKMELNEVRWEGPERIRLVQYRDNWTAVASTVMDSWVP
jgi:hypothetical protein